MNYLSLCDLILATETLSSSTHGLLHSIVAPLVSPCFCNISSIFSSRPLPLILNSPKNTIQIVLWLTPLSGLCLICFSLGTQISKSKEKLLD